MNARTIGYWATTGLTAAAFAAGGAMDLFRGPDVVAGMTHLGYPAYLAVILGVWKVLGAIAIAAPGLPRLKEWAYAGIAFDLTGAAISHAAVGDPLPKILTPLALLGLAAASWALRPASRTLGALGAKRGEREKPGLRAVPSAA
ncbi:MAG: DoxX family protein [Polyangiaceae bacterium]